MTIAPVDETKPSFTAEQKQALGRVYSFLIELGRQRLSRLSGVSKQEPPVEDDVFHPENGSTESETNPPT